VSAPLPTSLQSRSTSIAPFNSKCKAHGHGCRRFYLNNLLPYLEFMRIPVWAIPKSIMGNCNLWPLVHNVFITCLIRKGMYGLPQGGRIIIRLFAPAPHMPGLWRHTTRSTTFTLVVDDFGVKYTSLDDANHLVSALKDKYTIKEDWTGRSTRVSPSIGIGITTTALLTFRCQATMKRH
jgi:hypothetical protein